MTKGIERVPLGQGEDLEQQAFLQTIYDCMEIELQDKDYKPTSEWWPTEEERWVGAEFVKK